jgi:Glycosyl transferases group 1
MTRAFQQAVFRLAPARWAISIGLLSRGLLHFGRGRLYRGLDDLCWVWRVSGMPALKRAAHRRIFGTIETIRQTGRNAVVDSYLEDPASAACAAIYTQSGGGPHDLLRDLIVLKRRTQNEKGVILLKYVRTFDAVISMLDLRRLMQHYMFVLEPCWSGYCDPSLLMFIAAGQPVVVQCFTEEDVNFVTDIGTPLVPVRLGPADWVNADLFKPRALESKPYDLVMVANWGGHKRHAQLFKAMAQLKDRPVRALLVGFPWSGRTADDIRREAAAMKNERVHVDVVENVPAAQVADYVSQCKVFVFLSRKEGDNKALVEAMFTDVPAIVFDGTVGGASSRINASTGVFSSDADLAPTIVRMLDRYREFSPRKWALEHSGSENATRILNEVLRRIVVAAGGQYTENIVEKTNSPNLTYKDAAARARFKADYEFILTCRRGVLSAATDPAA